MHKKSRYLRVSSKLSTTRSSQAALEFLTTYGWAFLVILIMISALAYFGILSPSKILPERCTFSSQFACVDFLIQNTGTQKIQVKLRNNVGDVIDTSSQTISAEGATLLTCTPPANIIGWKPGEIKEFIWTPCTSFGSFNTDEKAKVLVTIKYFSEFSGSSYTKEARGELFGTVT